MINDTFNSGFSSRTVWSIAGLLLLASMCSTAVQAATVAHEGFGQGATVDSILSDAGHAPTELNASQVESGALLSGNEPAYEVFVISRGTAFAASTNYVNAVQAYVNAGGNIVTEWAGLTMFFSSYADDVYGGSTPQLGIFQGILHAGGYHGTNTPINILDGAHPVVQGLGNPYSDGGGTEFLWWVEDPDPALQVLGEFEGNGGTGFPEGQNLATIMTGCSGNSAFVFGGHDWNDTLGLSEALSRTFLTNAVAFATGGAAGCALPPPQEIVCPEYQDGGYGGDGDFVALDAPAQRCNWVPQAKINIKEGSGIGFEWRGSLSEEVLGTPTEDTSHVMCIYRDGMLVSQHQVAPGAGWKEGNAETRFNGKYGDSDGVEDMIFQASLDDAKGEVETDDSVLPELPAMPSYSFSVQLMNDAGLCLTADFPLPLDRDSGGRLVSEYSYSMDEE
jgi:hypothetical protein